MLGVLAGLFFFIGLPIIALMLKRNVSFHDKELDIVVLILSIIPLINLAVIFILSIILIDIYYKQFKKNERELNELNKLKECCSCEIIIRAGYIKDDVCPICKESSRFLYLREDYKPSNKIEEQKEIKNLKKYKNDILKEKTEEQELKHLAVLEKRLRKKSV